MRTFLTAICLVGEGLGLHGRAPTKNVYAALSGDERQNNHDAGTYNSIIGIYAHVHVYGLCEVRAFARAVHTGIQTNPANPEQKYRDPQQIEARVKSGALPSRHSSSQTSFITLVARCFSLSSSLLAGPILKAGRFPQPPQFYHQ